MVYLTMTELGTPGAVGNLTVNPEDDFDEMYGTDNEGDPITESMSSRTL